MINNITHDIHPINYKLIQAQELINSEPVQRVSAIAFCFLKLHPITASIAYTGIGLYTSGKIIADLRHENNWLEFAKKTGHLVIIITLIGYSIFFPVGYLVIFNTFNALHNLHKLYVDVCRHDWKKLSADSWKLTTQILLITSLVWATTELIFLSKASRVIKEVYLSYKEFKHHRYQGRYRYFEAVSHGIIAGIRAYRTLPYAQTLQRNYFGKQLTQEKWNQLYAHVEKGSTLEQLLIKEGISSHIKNISFVETRDLTNTCFNQVHFQNCDFTKVNFSSSKFSYVVADSSLFTGSNWVNTVVQNSRFTRCNFSFAHFNDSDLSGLFFNQCGLLETSFLGARVKHSVIAKSDLTDCLLLTAKKHFILVHCTPNIFTKPLVGIVFRFKVEGVYNPMMEVALKENGAIPVRIEVEPENIDIAKLNAEVETALKEINSHPREGMLSPASELIKQAKAGTEIAKITGQIAQYAKYLDGMFLTGGADIFPDTYGAVQENHTETDDDRRRMVYEFAMLSEAHAKGLPTMGVCRGSQLINIYFGGTLMQDIPSSIHHEHDIQVSDSSRKQWALEFFGPHFKSMSAHHQASDRIGKDLEVILEADTIPKFLMSKDGNFIASQIHPESYLISKQTRDIFFKIDWLAVFKGLFKPKPVPPKAIDHIHRISLFIDSEADMIERNQNIYRHFVAKAAKRPVI